MRTPVALISAGLLLAACGGTSANRAAPGDKLYEAIAVSHSQYVTVIDSRSHQTERRLPLGVPTSDWKHLYSLVDTSILDTDPQTGATLGTLQLGHAYRMPNATANGLPGGMAPNGRWLVVERYDAPEGDGLPSASHFLLINTQPLHVVGRIDLAGFFDFDAISNDGNRLFLVQYLNGREYYVRMYDVAAGFLEPNPVVDKTDASEAMSGIKLSGIASTDARWLFSMYVREHANPFIHALNLDGFALCLDLRGAGYAEDDKAMQWSIAMSPDGGTLYAANLGNGEVAVVSLTRDAPQVVRTAHVPLSSSTGGLIKTVSAKELALNAAVVSPDGKTLVVAGASGVVWIDTETLTIRKRALETWRIWSLGLSPNGQSLYAVADVGSIAELSMSSGEIGERFNLGGGQPIALMRVAAP
jgi:hypothetical protein